MCLLHSSHSVRLSRHCALCSIYSIYCTAYLPWLGLPRMSTYTCMAKVTWTKVSASQHLTNHGTLTHMTNAFTLSIRATRRPSHVSRVCLSRSCHCCPRWTCCLPTWCACAVHSDQAGQSGGCVVCHRHQHGQHCTHPHVLGALVHIEAIRRVLLAHGARTVYPSAL